jgi:hypothetical protein
MITAQGKGRRLYILPHRQKLPQLPTNERVLKRFLILEYRQNWLNILLTYV